jgi:CRP-like cAMP-binding protein
MDRYLEYAVKEYHVDQYFSHWEKLKKQSRVYRKGEFISLFEPMKNIIFLISGTMKICYTSEDGNEFFFSIISSYSFFGELEYLKHKPLNCQFEAITDAICIEIPIDANRHLLDEDLKFYKFISNELATHLIQVSSNFVHKEVYPLKTRLASYLLLGNKQYDEITNLKSLSSTLHCSYRQLLRVLAEFCKEGYLEHCSQKGTYRLIGYDQLRSAANTFSRKL